MCVESERGQAALKERGKPMAVPMAVGVFSFIILKVTITHMWRLLSANKALFSGRLQDSGGSRIQARLNH